MDKLFGIHYGLITAGRIPSVISMQKRISVLEMMLLFLFGIAAAVSSCLFHHGLRLPGSSIVFSLIPMARTCSRTAEKRRMYHGRRRIELGGPF
jgi:hypothetical protein